MLLRVKSMFRRILYIYTVLHTIHEISSHLDPWISPLLQWRCITHLLDSVPPTQKAPDYIPSTLYLRLLHYFSRRLIIHTVCMFSHFKTFLYTTLTLSYLHYTTLPHDLSELCYNFIYTSLYQLFTEKSNLNMNKITVNSCGGTDPEAGPLTPAEGSQRTAVG